MVRRFNSALISANLRLGDGTSLLTDGTSFDLDLLPITAATGDCAVDGVTTFVPGLVLRYFVPASDALL